MKFLLDANLPRSTISLLQNLGHEVWDVRDVLPAGMDDARVAEYAQSRHLALVTRDFDFADIRNYPPERFAGLVVLDLPEDAIASVINAALEAFASDESMLAKLPGRLAIVETWRVRFRPA